MRIKKRTIIDLMAGYLILWTFIPPVQVGTLYRVLAVGCLFLWFVKSVNQQFVRRFSRYILLAGVSIIGNVLLRYLAFQSLAEAIAGSLQWIIILSVGLIIQYYLDVNPAYLKRLLIVWMVVVPVFCITTIQADLINPYASRIANSEWLAERFAENKNVGLYGFVFMCVFSLPCLIYALKEIKSMPRWIRVLMYVDVLLITVMILVAGYSLAIICAGISSAIVLFVNFKKPIRMVVLLVLSAVGLLFYRQILMGILRMLISLTENNVVFQEKFAEFYLFLAYGSQSGDLAERLKNYAHSLNNILQYPVVGCYFFGTKGGGGHSFILDAIGKMGWLFGGISVYLMVRMPFKINGIRRKNVLDWAMVVSWLLFLIADPICQELAIAVFMIFPIIQMLCKEQRNAWQGEVA